MKHHPIEVVYKSLTSIVKPYISEPEYVQEKCSCCESFAREFNYLVYRLLNNYKQPVMHCPQCQTFFISAPDILGLETPKKISSQRFGMWPGVGTLITYKSAIQCVRSGGRNLY